MRPLPKKIPTPPPPLCACRRTLTYVLSCPRCEARDFRASLIVAMAVALVIGLCMGWLTVKFGWVSVYS